MRFVREIVPNARVGDLITISTIDVYDSPQECIFDPSFMPPNQNHEHCCTCMLNALDLRCVEDRLDSLTEESGQS